MLEQRTLYSFSPNRARRSATPGFVLLIESRNMKKCCLEGTRSGSAWPQAMSRYRKVTICARVQGLLGEKAVALVPVVMPHSTAQRTAL